MSTTESSPAEVVVALTPAGLLAQAETAGTVREAATQLRQSLAAAGQALRVVVVDAFDMRHETPLASSTRFVLWGALSDGHCWQVRSPSSEAADQPEALLGLSGLYLAAR